MASSFSGVEIRKQADLAVAAVKAVGGASKLTEAEQRRVNATVTEAIAKYDALGQKAPADLRKLQAETNKVEKSTGLLGGTLGKIGGALAATFAVGQVTAAISKTIEYAGTIKDTANQLGISTRKAQEWKFAAEQSGTSLEALSTATFQLQKNLGSGGSGVTGALSKLGLSLSELRNLRPDQQFEAVAAKLGDVRNATDRVTLGSTLMGKGFKDVSPLIAEGLQDQIDKANELGLVLDEGTIDALENLGDTWDTVKLAGTALIANVLKPFVPLMTDAANAVLPLLANLKVLATAHYRVAEAYFDLRRRLALKLGDDSGALEFGLALFEVRQQIENLGKSATEASGAQSGGSSGVAALDSAIAGLRDKLSGADIAGDLKDLEQAFKALTPAQQSNQNVVQRTLAEYEKLRRELPQVGGSLEDLRTANLKALEPLEGLQRHFGALASRWIPNAAQAFKAGQSALDGLARSGALLSSRLVPIEVQMKAMPPLIKGSAVAAADWARRQEEAAEAAKRWRKGLEDVAQAFATLEQTAPGALGKVAGLMGRVVSSVNLAVKGFDNLMAGIKAGPGTLEGIAGITSGVLGLASAVLSLGSAIADALFKSRAEKTMERVAYEFGVGISESLAQGIEDEAKRQFGGNRQASKIFHLDQIISEGGGLSAQNFQQLFARFRDLFSMVETGAFTAAQGIEVLDKNFKTFADFVTKDGSLASKELLEIIDLTGRFGLKSAEVSAFVVGETNKALTGLTTFLDNAQVKTQAAADGIAAAIFGIFEAQSENGVPVAQIVQQLDPLIKDLDAQLKKAGLTGGKAFDEIKELAAVAGHEIAGPLITGVLGLDKALGGLHNSGVLTEDMFDGITAAVGDTYQEILATGVSGAKALQLIAPTLQTAWELSEDFGYSLDDNTKKMIDEAKAAGLVGDEHRTATEQMLAATKRIADAVEGLARLFGVVLPGEVDKFAGALDDLPDDVTVRGSVDWDTSGFPTDYDPSRMPQIQPDPGVPGYRIGTPGLGFVNFGSGRTVRLHGDEAVVPEHRKEEAAARWGGGGGTEVYLGPVYVNGQINDHERRLLAAELATLLPGQIANGGAAMDEWMRLIQSGRR